MFQVQILTVTQRPGRFPARDLRSAGGDHKPAAATAGPGTIRDAARPAERVRRPLCTRAHQAIQLILQYFWFQFLPSPNQRPAE